MIAQLLLRFSLLAVIWSAGAQATLAQNSSAFARTKATLDSDRKKLTQTKIDLSVRLDSLNSRLTRLNARAGEIRAMPAGIGRDAALAGYNRDLASWRSARDQYNVDKQAYADKVKDFNQRLADYNRRVKTANEANRFRVGQTVSVLWRGKWWSARVLRVENGRYYVTYPGYGSNWNEWVGPSRIRR